MLVALMIRMELVGHRLLKGRGGFVLITPAAAKVDERSIAISKSLGRKR